MVLLVMAVVFSLPVESSLAFVAEEQEIVLFGPIFVPEEVLLFIMQGKYCSNLSFLIIATSVYVEKYILSCWYHKDSLGIEI